MAKTIKPDDSDTKKSIRTQMSSGSQSVEDSERKQSPAEKLTSIKSFHHLSREKERIEDIIRFAEKRIKINKKQLTTLTKQVTEKITKLKQLHKKSKDWHALVARIVFKREIQKYRQTKSYMNRLERANQLFTDDIQRYKAKKEQLEKLLKPKKTTENKPIISAEPKPEIKGPSTEDQLRIIASNKTSKQKDPEDPSIYEVQTCYEIQTWTPSENSDPEFTFENPLNLKQLEHHLSKFGTTIPKGILNNRDFQLDFTALKNRINLYDLSKPESRRIIAQENKDLLSKWFGKSIVETLSHPLYRQAEPNQTEATNLLDFAAKKEPGELAQSVTSYYQTIFTAITGN